LADGTHQNVSATNTDDATSATGAPLKSAGGLAVAKRAWFGDTIISDKDKFLQARSGGLQPIVSELTKSKVCTKDTNSPIISFSIPNVAISAQITLDYIVNSDVARRFNTGQISLLVARAANNNTVVSVSAISNAQSVITNSSEVLTETFNTGTLTGGTGDTQTFNLEVNISVNTSTTKEHIHYRAKILNSTYSSTGGYEISVIGL